MGCFNVACNLTGHSMYSEKAVFVGLVPSPYSSVKLPYMHYPTAIYTPLILPIYGKLDTYGRLEDIKETAYVSFLRSKNINPEDFFDKNKITLEPFDNFTGTFISQKALDYCKKYIYNDSGTNVQKTSSSKSNFILDMEQHFTTNNWLDIDQDDLLTNRHAYENDTFFRQIFYNLYLSKVHIKFVREYYTYWKEFANEFDDLNTLTTALSYSNKFWHPQSNGFQHGSRYQEYNLANLQKILSNVSNVSVDDLDEDDYPLINKYNSDFFSHFSELVSK